MEISEELKVGDLALCLFTKELGVVVRIETKRTYRKLWVLWSNTGKTVCEDEDNLTKVETTQENIK